MNNVYDNIFNNPNHEFLVSAIPVTKTQELEWNESIGIGYIKPELAEDLVYGQEYWDNYRKLIGTEIGKKLTKARIDIAKKFNIKPSRILDIGIGNGQFCDEFDCKGYDVNKVAVEYLKQNDKFVDIYGESYEWEWLSLWDVVEHLDNPTELLSKTNGVILSTPIYKNMMDCLNSKHCKPNEHIWYFTVHGMIYFMAKFGFNCKYYSTVETKCGRESIGSFVFTKD